jgi:hypothetical protein
MSMLVEVAIAANQVEVTLDELLVLGNKKNRRQYLELAVLASVRGLRILADEPFVLDPDAYLTELVERHGFNRESVRAELSEDTRRLRLFLEAECRLLRDLGVSERATARIRKDLGGLIQSSPEDVAGLSGLLSDLVKTLEGEFERLEDESRHDAVIRKLVGVFEALGGALVVGVDAVAGAAATPVTGGLSLIGAGASGVLGTEAVSRGAKRALG